MAKKTIQLTESELHSIIRESVEEALFGNRFRNNYNNQMQQNQAASATNKAFIQNIQGIAQNCSSLVNNIFNSCYKLAASDPNNTEARGQFQQWANTTKQHITNIYNVLNTIQQDAPSQNQNPVGNLLNRRQERQDYKAMKQNYQGYGDSLVAAKQQLGEVINEFYYFVKQQLPQGLQRVIHSVAQAVYAQGNQQLISGIERMESQLAQSLQQMKQALSQQ